jgi:hypothetical protein
MGSRGREAVQVPVAGEPSSIRHGVCRSRLLQLFGDDPPFYKLLNELIDINLI